MRKTFAITDEDGKRWLLDTKGTPIRDTVIGEWVDSKAISFDYLPDLPPIFREMFYFYAGEQRWEDEPVEIPPLGQFIKDVYSRKDEYGNKFKYFVFKIEDLANALGECRLREFFDITERYNEYRANHRGKAPGKYWVINRDEVPEIITKDEEGLCLWRTKPALNEDGVWWEDDEDYEEINSCIYYSITGYADLPKEGEIIEIDVTLVSPSQQLESKKYIKTRKHK